MTLAWVLGQRTETPITQTPTRDLTTRDLKSERVHADDVVEPGGYPWLTGRVLPLTFGEGVRDTITWLLGGSILLLTDRGSRVIEAGEEWLGYRHGGQPRRDVTERQSTRNAE